MKRKRRGKRTGLQFSLKWRFTVVLAGLLLLTVTVLGWLVLREIERDQAHKVEADLKQKSELADLRVRQIYLSDPQVDPLTFMRRNGQQLAVDLGTLLGGTHIVLYDAEGKQVGDSQPLSNSLNLTDTLAFAKEGKVVYQVIGSNMIYMSPIMWPVGQVGIVQIYHSLKADQDFYDSVERSMRNIGLVALVISLLAGFVYVQQVTRALARLRRAADRIRAGDYITDSPVRRRDELGELSEGIVYMSREIEQSFARQKQFIGNISHEFKTPLTSIMAYTDLLDMYRDDPGLLDEARSSIRKEADRLLEMVEKVLHLSSLEQYEFSQNAEAIDLKEVLEDVCSRMKGKAAQFGVKIETKLQPANVYADRESLMHIFLNLIDNAIKYNVTDGRIVITSHIAEKKGVVIVQDTGIGIPPEARAKLFEPFYTVSKDRARSTGGTGLGLSLVKRLLELQQGSIVWQAPPDDEPGAIFKVTLPALPATKEQKQTLTSNE